VVGEVLKFLPLVVRVFTSLELLLVDVEAGDGAPEVLLPGGQHTGLHHLAGLHEGHDVVDEAIRQGAQPVAAGQAAAAAAAAASCTGPLSFHVELHLVPGALPRAPRPLPGGEARRTKSPTGEDAAGTEATGRSY